MFHLWSFLVVILPSRKILLRLLTLLTKVFLLKVLKAFGFSNFCVTVFEQFYIWQSYLSQLIISKKKRSYFACSRGVRQGDILSLLLFYLVQEVLSRGLHMLVNTDKLKLIKGNMFARVPSHFYDDDVMFVLQKKFFNIQVLSNLFKRYVQISRHIINPKRLTWRFNFPC